MRQRINRTLLADEIRQLMPVERHAAARPVEIAVAVLRPVHGQAEVVKGIIVRGHGQQLGVLHVVAHAVEHIVGDDRLHRRLRAVPVGKQLGKQDLLAGLQVHSEAHGRAAVATIRLLALPGEGHGGRLSVLPDAARLHNRPTVDRHLRLLLRKARLDLRVDGHHHGVGLRLLPGHGVDGVRRRGKDGQTASACLVFLYCHHNLRCLRARGQQQGSHHRRKDSSHCPSPLYLMIGKKTPFVNKTNHPRVFFPSLLKNHWLKLPAVQRRPDRRENFFKIRHAAGWLAPEIILLKGHEEHAPPGHQRADARG